MSQRTTLFGGAVGLVLLGVVFAQGQQSGKQPALTALDYVQIQQLVSRYAHVHDGCLNEGKDYAELYVPDGVFTNQNGVVFAGRERLALASRGERGCQNRSPQNVGHFTVNLVITQTPEGVTGDSYMANIRIGENGQPSAVNSGGKYHDVYVNTPDGWRFKTRTYTLARRSNDPTPGSPAAPPAQ
jgi:hypothetical protein